MIDQDGFFDWAERHLLPADRIYPWRNTMTRLYYHSLEGFTTSGYWAFEDPRRDFTGWHWTKLLDGRLIQHAPIWAGLAHGGPAANPHGPGGEAEGKDEPLTEAQIQCEFRILHDVEEYRQMTFTRNGTNQFGKLVEHREAAQTSCPSGRYDEFWARFQAGERWQSEVPDPRIDKILAALGGEAAVDKWNATGNSLLAGYAIEQADQNDLEAKVAKLKLAILPDHTHIPGGVTP